MGHVINPLSLRLYNVRYWNNVWASSNKNNYSYLINSDILLINLCKKLLNNNFNGVSIGVIFVNLKLIRSFNSSDLYIYIHDSVLDLLFFSLRKNEKYLSLRKRIFKKFLARYQAFLSKRQIFLTKKKYTFLKKKILKKYSKKLFFLFLKNKLLTCYWNNFKLILKFYLKKFFKNSLFCNIRILGLSKMNINSNIISEFFFIRLKQYYTIWEVLKNVNYLFRGLMRKKLVKGYKITCSGRFSRKQRTTYSWKSFGSLASSSIKSKLDYSHKSIALKYSLCTIKVWIRLSRKKNLSKSKIFDFVV